MAQTIYLDSPINPQLLPLGLVGNQVLLQVPPGAATFASKIVGLANSGGAVIQFQGTSSTPDQGYSVFAAFGGNPYGASTSIASDASWAVACSGLQQILLVVTTAGTGVLAVTGTFSSTARVVDARLTGTVTTASVGVTSTQTAGTASATANTFTTAAAANASRKGGLIWNTSSGTLYVFFGSGTPTIAASFPLSPGQSMTFAAPGIVLTDQVQIAASVASASYVLNLN